MLETQQQYKEAGLKPVDSDYVPGIPEPGTMVLFIFAVLLVFYGRRMISHIRFALQI